ncbi:phage tail family protein [Paenibacillus dokdonensis]|uniref:Phage tail family protein n=1 Tax=Paenibacillus dokdonensis TaxID=2567944 RepID=A0ABU6GSM6_9BACL|nr:phage tail family protein [Paenibacillus dokdonensis]MEC0242762.1 phage tail family protein [Paenibacillus dokdonensis]
MQKVTFVNPRGESVVFDNSGPFVLQKIDGTANVPSDIKSTKSPYQDGTTFIGVQLSDRPIPLQGFIKAGSQQELYERRRELTRILNNKHGPGKLVYSNSSRSYAINAVSEEGPVLGDRYVNANLFTINFVANDPYWRDENQTVKGLRFEAGGLTFPLRLPTMFAFSAFRGTFINSGDVETPVEIRYQGPATNPVVSSETTGEYIKVNYVLKETDTLIINTAFGNKRVEVLNTDGTRTNVFHWIDLGSTFFQLQPGQNMLKYGSDRDSDQQAANVTIYWYNRYLGG